MTGGCWPSDLMARSSCGTCRTVAPAGAIREIPGPVHALAFSRDGRRLAVGAGLPARSGVVRLYTVPDGALIHDFAGHDDVVFAVALRPDGAQLASASFDQTVRLWNLGRAAPTGVFRGHSDFVYSLSYTPDGRSLLDRRQGPDDQAHRTPARSRKSATYSEHNEEVLAVAAHPDGKRFVSAGGEPQIRWWDLDGDKSQSRRDGHSGPVHQLAFSGDGRWLISCGKRQDSSALERNDRRAGQAVAGARVAIRGGDLGRRQLAAARRLGRAGTPLGHGLGPPLRHVAPAAGRRREQRRRSATRRASTGWRSLPAAMSPASASMIEMLTWRAGGVSLPAAAARAACDRSRDGGAGDARRAHRSVESSSPSKK